MKKAKKIIALVLVLALSISLLSTVAFAKDIGGGEEPVEAKKHTVLFFGDQSIDFENSYAPKFVEYLMNGPAKDSVVKGITANIIENDLEKDDEPADVLEDAGITTYANFSGMRNSDLYALIRPPKEDPILKIFDIDNPAPTQDAYFVNNILDKKLDYDNDGAKLQALQNALLGVTYREGSLIPIVDPDVKTIVLDLTRNDLTGYLMERLMDIVENGGDRTIEVYAEDTLARLPYDMSSEVHLILAVAMEALQLALNQVFYADADLAEQISAAAQYTMLNFCLGFTEAVAALKYWYPTAKLVAVGASNELKGVKITIPDKNNEGETITIDVGAIYQSIASFANAYITDFCSKYNVNNTYYYADVSKGVETIFQSDDDQEDFKAAIARDAAGRIGDIFEGVTVNALGEDYEDAITVIKEAIKDGTQAALIAEGTLVGNVATAAKEPSFNLVEILNIVNAPEEDGEGIDHADVLKPEEKTAMVMGLVAKAFIDGNNLPYDDLTPTDIAVLGLYGIIADMSYGTLPGTKGQEAKYDAVEIAYNKLLPANRDGEDAVGGFFLDGLFSVLNVFKSDILNTLNNFFNNLFDGGIFSRIGDFFRGIFTRG